MGSSETNFCRRNDLAEPTPWVSVWNASNVAQRRLWTVSEELTGVTFPVPALV